jgi:hypothetical protein
LDAGVELDVVDGEDVGGVGSRERDQTPVVTRDGYDEVALRDRAGEQPGDLGLHRQAAEVDHVQGERSRQRGGDLPFAGEAHVDEDLAQPDAATLTRRLTLRFEGSLELLLGDCALLDEYLA